MRLVEESQRIANPAAPQTILFAEDCLFGSWEVEKRLLVPSRRGV